MNDEMYVGRYPLLYGLIDVYFEEGSGGRFHAKGPQDIPTIFIGRDQDWEQVVEVLIHEAMEMKLDSLQCRYIASFCSGYDQSSFTFIMDHSQFTDVCERVSTLLVGCYEQLKEKYNQLKN